MGLGLDVGGALAESDGMVNWGSPVPPPSPGRISCCFLAARAFSGHVCRKTGNGEGSPSYLLFATSTSIPPMQVKVTLVLGLLSLEATRPHPFNGIALMRLC